MGHNQAISECEGGIDAIVNGPTGGEGVPRLPVSLAVMVVVHVGMAAAATRVLLGMARRWREDDSVDLPAVGESQVVTMGDSFGCAITDAHGVACWGLNDQGQLGRPTTGSNDQRAGMVTGLPIGFQAVSLDAGHDHACAVGAGGDVYCWGRNQEGQLGDNSSSDMVKVPLPVRALTVSAGATHTCVTTSDGGVTCWGTGADGQVGLSRSGNLPAPLTTG